MPRVRLKRPPTFREDGTILIHLTKGYAAVIDAADAHLAQRNWTVVVRGPDQKPYAAANVPSPDGPHPQRLVYLHRLVAGVDDPEVEVDHQNGDTLNCRRGNLRPASRVTNARNIDLPRNNTSGFLGVAWVAKRRRWRVKIGRKQVGYFTDLHEAAKARANAEADMWGVQPRRADAHDLASDRYGEDD